MKQTGRQFTMLLLALTTTLSLAAQKLEFFSPAIVRVTKTCNGGDQGRQSLVVTATPQKVAVAVEEKGNTVIYKTKALTVTVDKATQTVSFATRGGTKLMSEGGYALTPITQGADKGRYKVKQTFALDAEEPI